MSNRHEKEIPVQLKIGIRPIETGVVDLVRTINAIDGIQTVWSGAADPRKINWRRSMMIDHTQVWDGEWGYVAFAPHPRHASPRHCCRFTQLVLQRLWAKLKIQDKDQGGEFLRLEILPGELVLRWFPAFDADMLRAARAAAREMKAE